MQLRILCFASGVWLLQQQANLPESAAPSRPATFEDQLERMADPTLPAHALPSVEKVGVSMLRNIARAIVRRGELHTRRRV